MASDRRFGLPHPFDSDPSGDSSGGRKAGLWETLKRAMGTGPTAEPTPAPPAVDDRVEPRAAAPLRPAAPAPPLSFRPPAPLPVSPPGDDPSPPPGVELGLVEVAAGVPFLEDLPVAPPPVVEAPQALPATPPDASSPPEIAPPALPDRAPAPPGLARGLASFSRENAEREKKFAHLLRDSEPAGGKRPRGSRKRG